MGLRVGYEIAEDGGCRFGSAQDQGIRRSVLQLDRDTGMTDFIIDFREHGRESLRMMVPLLRHYEDMKIHTVERDEFTWVSFTSGNDGLRPPYESPDGRFAAMVVGQIAFSPAAWATAEKIPGKGGLMCKGILQEYASKNVDGLTNLNGNFIAFLHDVQKRQLYVALDRCGCVPCFMGYTTKAEPIVASNPDVLARILGVENAFDQVSMAEFLTTGQVSFPFSYYKNIRAVDFASLHVFNLKTSPVTHSQREYFDFRFHIDHKASADALGSEMATALRNAVNRRTVSQFGKTAIALSGGMDSRAFLCATERRENILTVTFCDKPNMETAAAQAVAHALGVTNILLKRQFDFYARSSVVWAKLSAGMGSLDLNHYVGFRDALRDLGITNLITGLYCDSMLKGLLLNRRRNRYLNRESLSPFDFEYYEPCFWGRGPHSEAVRGRLGDIFPEELRTATSDEALLEGERRRAFPIWRDHEVAVPQRVLPWSFPLADPEVVEVYLKIPPRLRINSVVFSKAVGLLCEEPVRRIPLSNTGAPVGASDISVLWNYYVRSLRSKMRAALRPSIATQESWPNWYFYLNNSAEIRSLWLSNASVSRDFLIAISGIDPYSKDICDYRGREVRLFTRLLTLKLWFEMRLSG